MQNSFLEKPALVMNIHDFAKGLNLVKRRSREIEFVLAERGLGGQITSEIVRKMKVDVFNSVGTLTVKGLVDIFEDLQNAGLPNHTSVKLYMDKCVIKKI